MSEKLNHISPEVQKSPELEKDNNNHHEKLKELKEKINKTPEISDNTIENIKKSIEAQAISKNNYNVGEKETKQPHAYRVTKHIKQNAYQRTIKQTQKHLNKSERAFSKAIHNPVVEQISEVGAKTVARPSGILFGGLFSFIFSLLTLIISKRSGFKYNYLIFILVFVGGYFCGLLIELVYRSLRSKKY